MINIITKKREWRDAIKQATNFDFYHTYHYHQLSAKKDETAILIKYSDNSNIILLPLIIRNIPNSSYKDATSVYGYAGPLCIPINSNFRNVKFRKELQEYFLQNKIVTVFSRLHPYIPYQESALIGLGTIQNTGSVVNINTNEALEDQRQQYSSRLKTQINKARKYCTIVKGETESHLLEFIKLYNENMVRVNATPDYFFSEQYFYELMLGTEYKTELLLNTLNETGEIIGASLFIKTNTIIQYHLSGSKEEYLHLNPAKLLIDEMRIIATKEGFKDFNLGGGLGCKDDSLFHFKSLFSKDLKMFKVWKYIVNEKAYNELIEQEKGPLVLVEKKDFFPLYR